MLIVVEGETDRKFIENYAKFLDLDSINIQVSGGKNN